MRGVSLAAPIAAIFMLAGCAGDMVEPDEIRFHADLGGAQEVPPVDTVASGRARIWYKRSTSTLTWTIDYQSLSAPMTAAHFHGPAAPGSNAGIQVPIASGPMPSPISGAAVLTRMQEADLVAGRYYINIHTQKNPGGEIRGQVIAAP